MLFFLIPKTKRISKSIVHEAYLLNGSNNYDGYSLEKVIKCVAQGVA